MDPRIEELLPFFVLDALTDEERELVESYLVEHPEAREQTDEMWSAASALPYSVEPVMPSSRAKAALIARVVEDERARASKANQSSGPRGRRLENFFQVLSLGVAAAAVAWAIILSVQLSQLRREVSTLGEALVTQSNSIEQINTNLSRATPSAVITVSLKGTDVQPQAHGQLIADLQSHSAVLVIAGLAQPEPGKTYQVWLINGAGPKSAGILTVDATGQGVALVTSEVTINSFTTLGISIEPEEGSPQPTGDIVVLSDL